MIGEVDVYGVFISPLLPIVMAALLLSAVVRTVLSRIGAYRLIWHKPLFDLAVFVIITGGISDMVRSAIGR